MYIEEENIQSIKPVPNEKPERLEMVKKILTGDEQAKTDFYILYEKMVKKLTYEFFYKKGNGGDSSVLEIEDYEQEVWRYLFENIYKYNSDRSMISTYVYVMTSACLRRYKENTARQLRLPVYKVQLFNRMKRFSNEYEILHGVLPNECVLKKEFKLSKKDIIQFNDYAVSISSLEQSISNDEDANNLYSVLKSHEDTERIGMSKILYDEIKEKIFTDGVLQDQQKEITQMWLFEEIPDKEICEILDIKKANLIYEKEKIKRVLQKVLVQYKKDVI